MRPDRPGKLEGSEHLTVGRATIRSLPLAVLTHCYFILALSLMKSDNRADLRSVRQERMMVALNGLEKFSHLEDKIYRTIELAKTLRQEKDELERQLATVRGLGGDKQQLIAQIERLLAEREAVRTRVQAMLETVAAADPELAEAIRGCAQTRPAP